MLQLQPRENFTIVRQLQDHTDSTTYYVRAVIRNSYTDAIIETINLTDRTGRRFTRIWQVIADVSGLGTYIDITTSVYTDAGYTTKAGAYGDEGETFLVLDRTKGSGGGGGGGADINYKKIKEIVKKEVEEIKIPEFPKYEKTDLTFVTKQLKTLEEAVNSIEMPTIEKTDLAPVLAMVSEAKRSIIASVEAIEIPDPTDIGPIMEIFDKSKLDDIQNVTKQGIEILSKIEALFADSIPGIKENLEDAKKNLKDFVYLTTTDKRPAEDKKKQGIERARGLFIRKTL